ncbi:M20/M25/M40 family metallo-hydrolase [Hyalangium versicolor]|uniref:M20/M25/M40 family metallo-hydrolase n=1 Tax=Hyalangium versicolor TaxID=2861190 RepID=UPI001CCD8F19|nr:M20/M25/M40 family metallo-hydrolase [Hyalangium versicolor]
MAMKHLAPAALWLWGAAPVLAHAATPVPAIAQQAAVDREQWITLGADTLEPVLEALRGAGWQEPPSPLVEKNGVVALKVSESLLPVIGRVMHERYNRCAGFIAHDSEQEATQAQEKAGTQVPVKNLVTYTIDNAATVGVLLGEMQESNVRSTITTLSNFNNRYYTASTGVEAANWLKSHWESLAVAMGRSDVTVSLFPHPNWSQPSVILSIPGTTLPNEVVVLGGHLDSINGSSPSSGRAPGADDDASGIASLTEVIRVAMQTGYRPARTVRFMGYAAEEVGLKGSKEIAESYKSSAVNVVGVLQLDMTNYHGSSVDFGVLTDHVNAAQTAFVTNLIDTYTIGTWASTACGYGCSDHVSWTDNGFASSLPFEALMNQDNPTIHTTEDTLAQSGGTATHAVKFSKLAGAFMAELAKGEVAGAAGDNTPPMALITAPAVGATVTGTATITANAADDVAVKRVEFWVNGVLKGTDTSAPYSYAWDTVAGGNGSRSLVVKAYDAAGNVGTSSSVPVTVSNASTTATYDTALKAPKCGSANAVCDSGVLLNGRANLGPEPNKANTINGSCSDGATGVYHSDESVDRLRVSTVDGTPFKAGKQVKVEATVWAFSTYTSDRLELYSTATANSPQWTLLSTMTPTKSGAQILSTTFTLPAGAQQAVRARFRYGGSAGACGTGGFDDHDDLVFTVSQ